MNWMFLVLCSCAVISSSFLLGLVFVAVCLGHDACLASVYVSLITLIYSSSSSPPLFTCRRCFSFVFVVFFVIHPRFFLSQVRLSLPLDESPQSFMLVSLFLVCHARFMGRFLFSCESLFNSLGQPLPSPSFTHTIRAPPSLS